MIDKEIFLGKSQEDIEKICKEKNIKFRYYMVNGRHRVLAADYKPERINFALENNVIVDAYFG